MKVKVITATNNTARTITRSIEEWITCESPTEIISMVQSSCNDDRTGAYIVTITIIYKKDSDKQQG